MSDEPIADRLGRIEQRLSRIENALGLSADESPAEPVILGDPWLEVEPVVAVPPLPPVMPPPPRVKPIPDHLKPAEPSIAQVPLEQMIGLKWAGWVGAIVLVIGAGLGIKFAYDQYWFSAVSPTVRLTMIFLISFALIGVGEWVYRKVNELSAAGPFGAGVAILFLSSYAGHAYYGLYERNTAFLLMTLSTLTGAAVAMRANLVSIAILSLIGGNLAPALLQGDRSQVTGFMFYLLMLQIVSLVVACWGGGRKWWILRGLSLIGTSFWMVSILFDRPANAFDATLIFMLVYAILYQAELIISGLRRNRASGDLKVGVNFSLVVTAALTIGLLYLLRDSSDFTRTVWVLALASTTGALAVGLSRAKATLKPLAMGFAAQSAALIVVAVPVAFSGLWITVAWGILAVAFAVLARVLELPIARFFAAGVWALAVGDLVQRTNGFYGPRPNQAKEIWLTILQTDIPAYAFIGWLLAIIGHVVAWLIRSDRRDLPRSIALLSTTLWIAVALLALPAKGATVCFVAFAWLLVAADVLVPEYGLLAHAITIIAIAAIKWMAVDTLAARLMPGWTAGNQWPVVNPLMGTGLLVAGSIVGIHRLRRSAVSELLGPSDRSSALGLWLAAIVVLILTVGLSFEIDRTVEQARIASSFPTWQLKQMGWTMLWTLVVCTFIGYVTKTVSDSAATRWLHGGSILVSLLAAKFFLVDTLLYRVFDGSSPATPVLNLQLLTGLIVATSLVALRIMAQPKAAGALLPKQTTSSISLAALLIVLWTFTMEIDRAFQQMAATSTGPFADPRLAEQVAISIFWSAFAVGSVIAGFRWRAAGLRYFGLALFAVTLLKVGTVDMSQVGTGYRILSFVGLGGLLLGTSVLYGRLSLRLLHEA